MFARILAVSVAITAVVSVTAQQNLRAVNATAEHPGRPNFNWTGHGPSSGEGNATGGLRTFTRNGMHHFNYTNYHPINASVAAHGEHPSSVDPGLWNANTSETNHLPAFDWQSLAALNFTPGSVEPEAASGDVAAAVTGVDFEPQETDV